MSTRRMNRTLLLIALPCVVLLALLNVYPVLNAGWESLNNGNMIATSPFVGLRNYIFVLTSPLSGFWPASLLTLIYAVCGVFGGWALGFALALLLHARVALAGLWRVLLLLPWVIPTTVTAGAWQLLFYSHHSPGSLLLHDLGFGWVEFFDDPTLARVMLFAFRVWLSFPFMFLLMSSALASVDRNVYEAARADGANAWQIFTRITLPMTSRTTYIAWILMAIMCVNDYSNIALLTGGGPMNATQTLMVLGWQNAGMGTEQAGGGIPDATAIGFLLTIVLVTVSLLLYRRVQKSGGDWTVDSASLGSGGAAPGRPRGRWWLLLAVVPITALLLFPLSSVLEQNVLGGGTLHGFLLNLKSAIDPATLAMLGRTSVLTVITVVVCLAVAAPAGYAIARGRSRTLSGVALLTFAVQSFPVLLLLWPMMVVFARMGIISTLLSVQIVYIAMTLGFATWVFWSFFKTMPIDIEEAAWADGCSVIGAFLRIVVPNAVPAIISTGMFVFLLAWGDWQVASVFLNLSAEPIVELLTPIPTLSIGAAQSLLVILPPIVVFLALSRYVSLGGVAASFSRR